MIENVKDARIIDFYWAAVMGFGKIPSIVTVMTLWEK
jgi:hypothetical protein